MLLPICPVKRLAPLDAVDQLRDVGDVENSAQIRVQLVVHCAGGMPNHWLRAQRPSLTAYDAAFINRLQPADPLPTSMAHAVDDRTLRSIEDVARAEATPARRRACAVLQARCPTKLGGTGATSAASLAHAAWCSSFLGTFWAAGDACSQLFPPLAEVDLLRHPHVWFAEVRGGYEALRERRAKLPTTRRAIWTRHRLRRRS